MLKEITLEVLKNQDKKTLETGEADGKAETFFKSLVKLEFLKILFIDIGISLGDVLTDNYVQKNCMLVYSIGRYFF